MYFTTLTPTLSRKEREQNWSGLTYPSRFGKGFRVRVFVLRSQPLHDFRNSLFLARKTGGARNRVRRGAGFPACGFSFGLGGLGSPPH